MKTGLYVGSFDPFTRGHTDIARQALDIFDRIVIGVGDNPKKNHIFSEGRRQGLIKSAIREEGLDQDRVTVTSYNTTIMRHAEEIGAQAIIRGLRQVSDFNDEFALHGILERTTALPVVYLICRQEFLHVSSSTARELAQYGEAVGWLVHPTVENALKAVYEFKMD